MRPESLHITLKFIGEQSAEQVEAITSGCGVVESDARSKFVLRDTDSSRPRKRRACSGSEFTPVLSLPNWPRLSTRRSAELGIPREDRPYSPHLTLARAGGRSGSPKWRKGDGPNATFAVLKSGWLQWESSISADDGREFILYQSQLSPAGSKYTRLQRFPMR